MKRELFAAMVGGAVDNQDVLPGKFSGEDIEEYLEASFDVGMIR